MRLSVVEDDVIDEDRGIHGFAGSDVLVVDIEGEAIDIAIDFGEAIKVDPIAIGVEGLINSALDAAGAGIASFGADIDADGEYDGADIADSQLDVVELAIAFGGGEAEAILDDLFSN